MHSPCYILQWRPEMATYCFIYNKRAFEDGDRKSNSFSVLNSTNWFSFSQSGSYSFMNVQFPKSARMLLENNMCLT